MTFGKLLFATVCILATTQALASESKSTIISVTSAQGQAFGDLSQSALVAELDVRLLGDTSLNTAAAGSKTYTGPIAVNGVLYVGTPVQAGACEIAAGAYNLQSVAPAILDTNGISRLDVVATGSTSLRMFMTAGKVVEGIKHIGSMAENKSGNTLTGDLLIVSSDGKSCINGLNIPQLKFELPR